MYIAHAYVRFRSSWRFLAAEFYPIKIQEAQDPTAGQFFPTIDLVGQSEGSARTLDSKLVMGHTSSHRRIASHSELSPKSPGDVGLWDPEDVGVSLVLSVFLRCVAA